MEEVYDKQIIAEYRKQLDHCADYRGCFYPNAYLFKAVSHIHTVDKFIPREDDIFLVSYPKSGTTWMAELLTLILQGGDENIQKTMVHSRVDQLEGFSSAAALYKGALSKLNFRSLGFTMVTPILNKRFSGPACPGRRVIMTHVPLEWLPKEVFQLKCKIIYLSRNPKDVMVSDYYFHKEFFGFSSNFKMGWDDFFKVFMAGKCVYGCWFDHVRSYFALAQNNPNLLSVKYEQLKKDLPNQVSEIAKFIDVSLDTKTCEKIANLTHIDHLRKVRTYKLEKRYSKLFTRKGLVGGWKNHFTVAQDEIFHKIYSAKMVDLPLVYD